MSDFKVKGDGPSAVKVMRARFVSVGIGYVCVSAVIIAMIGMCGWSPRCAPDGVEVER